MVTGASWVHFKPLKTKIGQKTSLTPFFHRNLQLLKKSQPCIFFPLICTLFLSKNVCKNRRLQDTSLISLFRKTKGFFCFCVNNRPQKAPPSFLRYVLTGKRSANQRKKIQDCDFLLNQRPHAKIQLIWTKEKNRPKFDIEWLCRDVFNL